MEAARFRGVEQRRDERVADAAALPVVAHDDGHFGGAGLHGAEAREPNHAALGVRARVFGHERDAAPMIDARKSTNDRVGQRRHRRQKSKIPARVAQPAVQRANRLALARMQRANPDAPPAVEREMRFQLGRVRVFVLHRVSHDV